MASVRDTIFKMLTEYPSLFTTKTGCFQHLFFDNGNGYDWIDGELVACFSSKSGPDFQDEDEVIQKHNEKYGSNPNYENMFGHEEYGYIRLNIRRNNQAIQFAIDNIDLIMLSENLMFCSGSNIYYAGWKYCKLMQVPDDVKPDWLDAVHEVRRGLVPYLNQSKEFQKQLSDGIKQLEQDLARLKTERFPEEVERDARRGDIIKELLANIKDKEKN